MMLLDWIMQTRPEQKNTGPVMWQCLYKFFGVITLGIKKTTVLVLRSCFVSLHFFNVQHLDKLLLEWSTKNTFYKKLNWYNKGLLQHT